MKVVLSDQKTGKAYLFSTEQDVFVGKKIGDTVKLDELGLAGYEGRITGGSDKQGFPMNVSISGPGRKKILTANAPGFKAKRKGEKKRVSVRGNTISSEMAQVNAVISKYGAAKIEEIYKKSEPSEEDKMSAKERAIKRSLEQAGSAKLGSGVKKAKH